MNEGMFSLFHKENTVATWVPYSVQVTSENLAIFSRKYVLVFMVSKVPVLHSWYLYESTIQVLSVDYLTNRNQLTN